MPYKPPTPCVVCGQLVEGGGRCPKHRRTQYAEANARALAHDPTRRVYADPRWTRLSKQARLEQPICAHPGCSRPSEDADHIVPLSEGGAPFDRSNVICWCKRHHGRKTKADRIRRARART